MADNIVEYTPIQVMPNMSGPAWPDNSRKAIEMSLLPVEEGPKEKKKSNKKKKDRWDYDPTMFAIPQPGSGLMFGSDRLGAPRNPFELPIGPFEDNLRVPRVGMPVPAGTRIAEDRPEPKEEHSRNWFQRLFGPDESELEAERNGMRWHWALEHRFMPPGSKWNETVWQGVDRENAWLAKMLQQQKMNGPGNGSNLSPIAKQRELSRISGQYDKLVAEYLKGNWDDPERAYKDFLVEAERLRKQYAEQGGAYEDLRLPPPVAGNRTGFTTQSKSYDLRKQYTFAERVNKELASWLELDETGKRKIDNPDFIREKKVYLDSVYERVLKHIKESSNAMADEEKQRLQILVLPDNAMDEVIKEVQGFQNALRGIMSSASAKDWSQNNKGKVNEVIQAMGFDPSKDKVTLGNQLATLGGVIVSSLARNDELPHDVATDLNAAKTKFDTYMKNMMLSATVAPHIVANITALLANTVADEYNSQAFVAGRGDADHLKPLADISEQIPRDAMPLSELIKHSNYVWPSLAKDPKGKLSSQAESEGETEPAGTAVVPGIIFED